MQKKDLTFAKDGTLRQISSGAPVSDFTAVAASMKAAKEELGNDFNRVLGYII